MKSTIVAVVDDDITHYLMLKAFISSVQANIPTLHFKNGKEAYNYLIRNASNKVMLPDYIFVDIAMPEMDGWEFVDEFHKIQNSLQKQVTVYINSATLDHHERALKHPAVTDFLHKPINHSQIHKIFKKT
jgi:CheY-like chemotaxis protein